MPVFLDGQDDLTMCRCFRSQREKESDAKNEEMFYSPFCVADIVTNVIGCIAEITQIAAIWF